MFAYACEDNAKSLSPALQFTHDLEIIDSWLTENSITDTLIHPLSRIRYTINENGTGIGPRDLEDTVRVDFEGRFLESEEVFASEASFDIKIDDAIPGWKIMLIEMIEGDEFTIYLPSIYGYATSGSGPVPANAVLVFDLKLLRVSN